ncbi:MAG: DCC1-like thiol-disulfide oxidoreductase family protein [Verrucomicrobiota bacterium]
MNTLHVFYDSHCGMCRRFRAWLTAEPQIVRLSFHSYRLPGAKAICPNLDEYRPGSELVVMADSGEIYQGPRAWIMCLWALENHRELAMKLSQPRWFGFTKRICRLVSENRLGLSKLFFGKDAQFLAELENAETTNPNTCTDEACHL